jgi:hypothetical protein
VKRLSKKSRFLLDKLKRALALGRKLGAKEEVEKLEEEVNVYLEPKKSKFFKAQLKVNQKKKFKKKLKFKKGTDPRLIARRLNGAKGGNKTAALYSRKTRAEWGSKAGNSTLQRYGRGFFSHIRKHRKTYPKHRKIVK